MCRSKEELNIIKNAAAIAAGEGVRILKDQIYLIKVNNARTNAVLQLNNKLKEDVILALSNSNNTQVAKVF